MSDTKTVKKASAGRNDVTFLYPTYLVYFFRVRAHFFLARIFSLNLIMRTRTLLVIVSRTARYRHRGVFVFVVEGNRETIEVDVDVATVFLNGDRNETIEIVSNLR